MSTNDEFASVAISAYSFPVVGSVQPQESAPLIPPSVNKKALEAAESVYSKFRCIHKAEFLLLSLDASDVAKKVGKYREDTINFRKKLVAITKWEAGHDYPVLLSEELISTIKTERQKFIEERNDCLATIAACKQLLKEID